MPERANRPCAQCGVSTQGKYCPEHITDNREIRSKREYDKERRENDPYRHLYNLALWQKVRKAVLRRDPLCTIAVLCGGTAGSTVVDHIVPARVHCATGGSFWDKRNLQGSCKRCHDYKTAKEDGAFGKSDATNVSG